MSKKSPATAETVDTKLMEAKTIVPVVKKEKEEKIPKRIVLDFSDIDTFEERISILVSAFIDKFGANFSIEDIPVEVKLDKVPDTNHFLGTVTVNESKVAITTQPMKNKDGSIGMRVKFIPTITNALNTVNPYGLGEYRNKLSFTRVIERITKLTNKTA